jgi:ADP-ribose pyrophosphatase
VKKVQIESQSRLLDDFFKVDEAVVRYEQFDGQMSAPTRLLNLDRGDSAAVLLVNQRSQKVILVNQFRYPTYQEGLGWILELVAGKVEVEENPEKSVRREIFEEIGYEVKNLLHITTFYPSPGGSSERIFLYYAEVLDENKIAKGGGLRQAHEDTQIVEIPIQEAFGLMETGEILDAKTIIAFLWLKLNVNRENENS